MTSAAYPPSEATCGSLSPGSLVRVLRTLHVGRHTGVLILNRSSERLGLRFLYGRIVSGFDGPVGRLGDILQRCGQVSPQDLERALEKAALKGRRLGPVLVEEGLATREQVQEALRLQVRDVLFAAFFWGFGAYRFEADEGPSFDEEISLEMSTTSLVFEVVSCLESPRAVLLSLADLDAPITAAPDAAERLDRDHANLSPADGYVLSRADEVMAVRQIVETAPLPAEAVERSLVALLCCDAVRALPVKAAKRLPSPNETVALPRASLGLDALLKRGQEADRFLKEMDGKNHFGVLGLPEGASAEEIKQAYLRLAKSYHPDTVRDPDLAQVVKAIFLRVSEAYNVLGSADSRARFERSLGGGSSLPPSRSEDAVPLPEPAEAVLHAEELVAAGKPFEAASLIEDILPHAQGRLRTRSRLLRARAYLKTPSGGHVAEKELRDLLQEEPDCIEACLALAALYRDLGLSRRAQAHYRRVLDLQPGHAVATTELRTLPLGDLVGSRTHRLIPRGSAGAPAGS